jgi:hypothetical protein
MSSKLIKYGLIAAVVYLAYKLYDSDFDFGVSNGNGSWQ